MTNQSNSFIFALCSMSIAVSNQELDAFIICKLESEEQLDFAAYAAAQTYMNTNGYDNGFVSEDLECRLTPHDAKVISESEANFLSKMLNVRIVNSLDELSPNYELIREVMSE